MRISTQSTVEAEAARWVARRDAGLNPAEQTALARWLDADIAHGEALARYAQTWETLARPRRLGAAPDLARKLESLGRGRRWRLAAAGSALVLVLATSLVWWNSSAPSAAPPAPAHPAIVTLPERRSLPDGSTIEMKPGAAIAVEFSPATRRVRLTRGEALFAVVKNSARPFVVEARGVEVRAVGTAFVVQLESDAVDVIVTEGSVAVRELEPPATVHPPKLVAAGERILISDTRAAPEVTALSAVELAERLAWRSPQMEFSGEPLAEVVATINRHAVKGTAVRFVIGDAALEHVPLSGRFRVDDTEAFLRMLEVGFGVKAERRGEHEMVLRLAR